MLFLALSLISLLFGRAEYIIAMALSIAATIPIVSAQRAANSAAGDPEGKSNAGITLQNFLSLVVFWVVWGSIFASSYFAATKLRPAP
jgi:hypothetical protein